ncbi:MAG: hypothetical protein ABIR71_04210 [Chthoniobacterales bacterium]
MFQRAISFLLPLIASVVAVSPAFAQWHQTAGPSGGRATVLYAKGDLLLTGLYRGEVGTLLRSGDHGRHWAASAMGLSGVATSVVASPSTLFVATSNGIFRSADDLPAFARLSPDTWPVRTDPDRRK